MRGRARFGNLSGYQAVSASHVCYLNLRGSTFLVSSSIMGLFPDSVLMTMFPAGVIPLFNHFTGTDLAITLPSLRMAAQTAVQVAIANRSTSLLLSKSPKASPSESGPSDTTGTVEEPNAEFTNKRASFAGGDTMSKSSAVSWQKHYSAQADGSADEDDISQSSSSGSDGDNLDALQRAFRPEEESTERTLEGIESYKICSIAFDPVVFRFFLEYFCKLLKADVLIAAAAMEQPVSAISDTSDPAPPPLDPVEEEAVDHPDASVQADSPSARPPVNILSAEASLVSDAPKIDSSSGGTDRGPQTSVATAAPAARNKRRGSLTNFVRRVSGLKLSIVTFFAGQETGPSTLGPQETPSVATAPDLGGVIRPVRSVIVLREELEYFPISRWAEVSTEDADVKPNGIWETLKRKVRKSISKGNSKALLPSSSADADIRKNEQPSPFSGSAKASGDHMDGGNAPPSSTGGVGNKSPLDGYLPVISPQETLEVKRVCGMKLLEESAIATPYAEAAINVYSRGERGRAEPGPRAEGEDLEGVLEPPSVSAAPAPTVPTSVPAPASRERVVCEMEEPIMKRQLVSSLAFFSKDFDETSTKWDHRILEEGKNKVASVSMLRMRDGREVQLEVEAGAAALAAGPAPSSETPAATPSAQVRNGNEASSLITQVADTNAASVSSQHLNQHLILKRPVRKCWWELTTVKVDPIWLETHADGMGQRGESRKSWAGGSTTTGGWLSRRRSSLRAIEAAEGSDGTPVPPAAVVTSVDAQPPTSTSASVPHEEEESAPKAAAEGEGPPRLPPPDIPLPPSPSSRSDSGLAVNAPAASVPVGSSAVGGGKKLFAPSPAQIDVRLWVRRTWTVEFVSF
ncbi:hypothetical protein HKX48_009571 [Thoreauomyces humboldtii]|nr:hypothetical protein HKX48_009571 [Thoreauomyces humboldtii]